jgi:hypothetical protein
MIENNLPFADDKTPDPTVPQAKETDARGRPTKYDPAKNEEVTRLCLLGCTDDELAEFLGIDRSTFYDWKKRHEEFNDAIWLGKQGADSLVAESLFRSAKAGDVGAAKHWLNNRRPRDWRDKTETKVTIAAEQVFKIGDVEVKF